VKLIERAWLEYQQKVIHPDAPAIQIVESRRAFYAGAQSTFSGLVAMLDHSSPEPTPSDLRKIDDVQAEFLWFADEMRGGRA
jgi:hypothetical protein